MTCSCNPWNRQGNNGVKTLEKDCEHVVLQLSNFQSLKISALSTLKLTFACSFLMGGKKKPCKQSSSMTLLIWIQKAFAKSDDYISKSEVTICS